MAIFEKEKMGFECEENEDGSQVCRRYKNKGQRRFATGTEFELIPDPNTCRVRVSGRINEGDEDAVNKKIQDMETKCKKGF